MDAVLVDSNVLLERSSTHLAVQPRILGQGGLELNHVIVDVQADGPLGPLSSRGLPRHGQ
jgi:hypothetical protein